MAAQISGIFASIEKEEFESRLPVLLPIIQSQFVGDSRPGKFVKLVRENAAENRDEDHHFFQVMQLVIKICSNVPDFLTSDKYQENIHFLTGACVCVFLQTHQGG